MAGFLYFAVVLDAWSRKIVGWAMQTTCAPNWCWMRWRWLWANVGPRTSSTIATRAANIPRWHSASGVALQPGVQPGRADLALSAQPLARQLGVYQPGGHHGRLRDGLEPVCRRSRLDPLALSGRLGSGCARSTVVPVIKPYPEMEGTVVSRNFRRSVLFGIHTPQQFSPRRAEASSRRAISATSGPELSCAGGAHGSHRRSGLRAAASDDSRP
jgi:hypothetical protein